ncbi:MAG TPA: Ldh family oxidoreductase [Acidimicrobiales bacterium]|jgi:LDH2 family malate/lactate/ureidoglycolate dehydrogenase|nr:Ldh family oxidoreductase [Acidimicrobiales bacterium]
MGNDARTYGQWWDWTGPYATVPIADLTTVCRAAYESAGATSDDAAFLVEGQLDKTIQGDHARGIVYLPVTVRAARAGRQDLRAPIDVIRDRGASALVDGGPRAAGRLVCRAGMRVAIDKAREHGAGVVGARGGAGLLTQFVTMAVDAGMVGLVMTQTGPCVAPLGGRAPLLGNGPFAIGIPARNRDPVVLDMSFTSTSASGVLLAAEQGLSIPPGLLLDSEGQPTTDPRAFMNVSRTESPTDAHIRGTLTPLGAGHKGYAMLFVIGLLSSVLSDTSPPWDLAPRATARGTAGTLLLAIDPLALNPFAPDRVDEFIDTVTAAPRRAGADEILYPGQRSQRLRRERRARGTVEVPQPQLDALVELAREIGLEVPPSLRG